MISIIKGLIYSQRNSKTINPESCVTTCLFEYRGNRFSIENATPWDSAPYLGCKINRQATVSLIEWLQECLDDKRCDDCWNAVIPGQFYIPGEIKCIKCGEFYR